MALKQWMQANGVFDKELLRVFPKYDIHNPATDLQNLTPSEWKEIKSQQIRERSKNITNAAAKQRFKAKLTKIEKLWKASRQKDKKKSKKYKKKKHKKSKKNKQKDEETKEEEEEETTAGLLINTSKSNISSIKAPPRTPKTPRITIQELDNLRREKMRLQRENSNLILDFSLFKKMHKSKMDHLKEEKNVLNSQWEKKYGIKEVEFREIQKVYNKYKQLNYDHNNKKISIQNQLKEMNEKYDKLMQENNKLQEEINKLNQDKLQLESAQNQFREDMEQVKDYNNLLKENHNDEINENDALKLRIKDMLTSENDLKQEIEERNRKIKDLFERINELKEKEIDEISKTDIYIELEKENQELHKKNDKIKKRYEILYESSTGSSGYDINELIEENGSLKAKLRAGKKSALEDIVDEIFGDEEKEERDEEVELLIQERDSLKKLCTQMKIFIEENELNYQHQHQHKHQHVHSRPRSKSKKRKKSKKEKMMLSTENYMTAFD